MLLGRKRERVHERSLIRERLADGHQAADRLGVVDELLDRHLIAALEEPPPGGSRLAPVVLEELAGEPPRRPRFGALDERPA